MSNDEQKTDPSDFVQGGTRPHVRAYTQKPIFKLGDSVYLLKLDGTREGPYTVATAPIAGKCALSHADGMPFRGSEQISVDELEAV
ncbi:hypothetical protein ACJZ2D_001006 [Fusarium nematophilum]